MKTGVQIIGFSFLLTLIFTILKLVNLIDWSWVWVTSPTWLTMAVFLITTIGLLVFVLINKDTLDTMDRDK